MIVASLTVGGDGAKHIFGTHAGKMSLVDIFAPSYL